MEIENCCSIPFLFIKWFCFTCHFSFALCAQPTDGQTNVRIAIHEKYFLGNIWKCIRWINLYIGKGSVLNLLNRKYRISNWLRKYANNFSRVMIAGYFGRYIQKLAARLSQKLISYKLLVYISIFWRSTIFKDAQLLDVFPPERGGFNESNSKCS